MPVSCTFFHPSTPFSGLAPLAPSGCLCGLTALSPAAGSGPTVTPFSLQLSPHASVYRVVEGFPSPPCPRPSSPGTPSPSGVTLEVSSPWGNSSTLGVLMPFDNSTPLPLPGYPSWGFPPLQRPRGPPPCPPTPEDSPDGFSRRPAALSLTPGLSPWRPPAPSSSLAAEVTSLVPLPPAAVPPGSGPAPLPFVPRSISVRGSLTPPARPPCGLSFLLRHRPLRIFATPLGAFVCTILLVGYLRTVPPPCSVCLPVTEACAFSRSPVPP